MTKHKCKVGDVVYVRCGGPSMVVRAPTHNSAGKPAVETLWFTNSGQERAGTFPETFLEIIDDLLPRLA